MLNQYFLPNSLIDYLFSCDLRNSWFRFPYLFEFYFTFRSYSSFVALPKLKSMPNLKPVALR